MEIEEGRWLIDKDW